MFLKKLYKKYRHKKEVEKRKNIFKTILKDAFILVLALGFFGVSILLIWASTLKIPDFKAIGERKISNSTKIYDRTGEILLYDMHEDVQQTTVPFSEISSYVKNASVAIEDAEFYSHFGIRPLSILRATFANLTTGDLGQGGSTITQQVVKNTLLTQDKTISRKLKEWILAIKLEQAYTKDEILALYLNEAPYGGTIYGVEEASMTFFGKDAKDLTLPEAAYIAALPQRPTVLSPYGNHTDLLEKRKNQVLKNMLDQKFISQKQYDDAMATKVTFLPKASHGMKAPHFVTWVEEYLADMYGERSLEEDGYKVVTTLDYDLQAKAEKIVADYGKENEAKFNAKNAGMVGIDPKTGEVLVMVGSRDYFDTAHDGNFNITLSPNRQPGSSFKPFVYATAFKKGYTPETVLFNLRTQFSTACDAYGNPLGNATKKDCFMPVNYDGKYEGPMTLRNALAQSVNVPAVKLLYLAGIKDSITTAQKMGVTSLGKASDYGLTLVLGAGGVSPLEMTSAYGVFANDGVRMPYQNILRIEDGNGNVVKTFSATPETVLEPNIARQISDILSDNVARAPAFGQTSALNFPNRDVAVKTGTTNDYRDAWIIGYTPSFALGSWVGNNDNTPMEKKVAGFIVAPMWNAMMQEILAKYPEEKFIAPTITTTINDKPVLRGIWQGGEHYLIDSVSGMQATDQTPQNLITETIVPNVHDILYWINKDDPRGPAPSDPSNDPQFQLWETPVQEWLQASGQSASTTVSIPTGYDTVHTTENSPKINFAFPTQDMTLAKNTPTTIVITHTEVYPLAKVDYFVNNIFVGSSENTPFSFVFTPTDSNTISGTNTLKAVAHDAASNTGETTIMFNVQ